MHWAGADDGGLSAWSSTSDIEVEVSSAQPSAPDLGPASPPPAYNASAGPRPLEMDRPLAIPHAIDIHLAFAPTPTHYQIGIKRVMSSSSPDEPVMLTPTQQISTKSEGGTRIVFKPTLSSHDAVKVPEEDALILGPRKPLQRLGRSILFMLCIVAVFGVFVIDALVDRPEYCSLQPPPSAPPAAPAVGIVAAGKVCGEMAGARGAKFAWADSAAAGTPAGCIVFAAADGGGGGGGGGDDATGDAASGEASGEASESVLFQPECTAPPAGCACGNCTTCDIEGCAVLRSLDELLGGAAGGDAPWACPEEHIYKEKAGVKRMLAFVIYSACAFVAAFLLLTRDSFSARWTLIAWLPHDVQITIATIVLGYLWPYVLPVLLHKTHAVSRFLGQAQHRPNSWPYRSCAGRLISAQVRRHERARKYRARRAEARRERAEQRERRKAEARERRRRQQQENNQCCWYCCDSCACCCCAPPGPPYGTPPVGLQPPGQPPGPPPGPPPDPSPPYRPQQQGGGPGGGLGSEGGVYCDGYWCADCCHACCWWGTDLDCCFVCFGESLVRCCDGLDALVDLALDLFFSPLRLLAEAGSNVYVPNLGGESGLCETCERSCEQSCCDCNSGECACCEICARCCCCCCGGCDGCACDCVC